MIQSTNRTTLTLLALCVTLLGTAQLTRADVVLNFEQRVELDALGDGTFTLDMKFNASQFQEWQQRYGMNPSLLKREASRTFSQYELTDFQLEKNDMEREVKMIMKAKGVTRYMGSGKVELDVPKKWRLVNASDEELKFTHLESLGNGVAVQHVITAKLPEGASEISDPKPALGGVNRITYELPVDSRSSLPLILGVVLVLGGGGALTVGLLRRRSSPTASAAETDAA